MSVGSNIGCSAPSVILQEGLDDVSLIYANCTSAKIIIDATTEYKPTITPSALLTMFPKIMKLG
jgi:hypothetical protein